MAPNISDFKHVSTILPAEDDMEYWVPTQQLPMLAGRGGTTCADLVTKAETEAAYKARDVS